MTPEIVLSVLRGTERLIFAMTAALSLWCAFRLFTKARGTETKLELKVGSLALNFISAVPALTFFAFGTVVIVVSVLSPLKPTPLASSDSYAYQYAESQSSVQTSYLLHDHLDELERVVLAAREGDAGGAATIAAILYQEIYESHALSGSETIELEQLERQLASGSIHKADPRLAELRHKYSSAARLTE